MYIKIVIFAVIFFLVSTISAPALDIGIDKAVSLNIYFFNNRELISEFKIDVSGQRNPTPPQYFTAIEMMIHISGKDITPKRIERAIALSQEKYCSVYHSLRKDIKVDVKYNITHED